ncbi:hypothetical protein C8R44DRAFT_754948 [Mycena epipterygia]|nr:hypothetical protein C8R44DRAFT_754948 [Mycena epipterygia]
MPIQPNETDCALGPPGSREGFGEVVHPSRECLQAASSEHEISRSQGTRGPIPGYHSLGPSCNGSLALAVTELSEEQRVGTSPNIMLPTEHLSRDTMVNVEMEPRSQDDIAEGTNQRFDMSMGVVEVINEPCSNNDNIQANTINYTENENTNPHTENEYSHIQDNINGEPNEPRIVGNDWETKNLAIRKRNKPP